jgi:hypothetical protein
MRFNDQHKQQRKTVMFEGAKIRKREIGIQNNGG